jgi:phosphohistidine phosphatase SixA
MLLTILRHGKALDRKDWAGPDEERPLSDDGVEQTIRVVKRLAPAIRARAIWSSPWRRARHTAELAGRFWNLPVREQPWLAGKALSAGERTARLESGTDIVVVGHEPDLSAWAGHLCGARLRLRKAGLIILEGEPAALGMELVALLPPRLLLGIAT